MQVITAVALVISIVLSAILLLALRESRALLRTSDLLIRSLQEETLSLVKEATRLLSGTRTEMDRVRDLLELTESRSNAIDTVSRRAIDVVSAPIVRMRALRIGLRRAREIFSSRKA